MQRILIALLVLLCFAAPAGAVVELSLSGQPPQSLKEVYLRDGVPYLAIDDVLPALHLSGYWDSVRHIYLIHTPGGTAVISPGSHYLREGESFIPLDHRPRFIDNRLRVSEDFVTVQLPKLLGHGVYYRNLNPPDATVTPNESPLDRLFAFLLRKKKAAGGAALRGLVIDPGHGGEDPGSIAADGTMEKTLNLEVAKDLEKQVKMKMGIPVFLTRDRDYALSREKRLKDAARDKVDAFILLHAEASFDSRPEGILLFVRPPEAAPGGEAAAADDSLELARALQQSLTKAGLPVDGIVQAPLLPLGRGNLPTVLVEMGYLSNPADLARLKDPAGREQLAQALYGGLKAFAEDHKEKSK